MARKQIPHEALIDLNRRLNLLPPRSHQRRIVLQQTAELYGVSEATLYRALRKQSRPRALKRSYFDSSYELTVTFRLRTAPDSAQRADGTVL